MTGSNRRIASGSIVAILALAACSSSSSGHSSSAPPAATAAAVPTTSGPPIAASPTSPATAGTPASGPTTAAVTSPSSGATARGGTGDLATRGCTAIKIADAQALVAATVTEIEFTPGSAEVDAGHQFTCEFSDQAMLITIDPLDGSHEIYQQDVTAENGTADHPLSGVGDSAVWASPVMSNVVTSAPDVIAYKGSVTCKVESPGTGLTIPVDTGPISGSTVAEAEAFATKTGALCNDIFAAIG